MNFLYKSYNDTNITSIYRIFKLEKVTDKYQLTEHPEIFITPLTKNITLNYFLQNFKIINHYFNTQDFKFKNVHDFITYFSLLEKERTIRKRKHGNFLSEFIFTIDINFFKKFNTDVEVLNNLINWINKTKEFALEKLLKNVYIEDCYLVFSDEYNPLIHILFSPVTKDGYKYKLPGPPYYLNILYKEILLIL